MALSRGELHQVIAQFKNKNVNRPLWHLGYITSVLAMCKLTFVLLRWFAYLRIIAAR